MLFLSSGQEKVFLLLLCCGGISGIWYDLCSMLRLFWGKNSMAYALSDLLFWLGGCAVCMWGTRFGNGGDIHLYLFLAAVLGFFLYHVSFSFLWHVLFLKGKKWLSRRPPK